MPHSNPYPALVLLPTDAQKSPLLAFFTQQIGDLCDDAYQAGRKKMVPMKSFWQEVQVLFNRHLYESWYKLLEDLTYNTHTFIMPEPTG